MKPLQDTDLMPFGKYKGKLTQDVPASYLHYLWITGMKQLPRNVDAVADYIYDNMSALEQEHKEGIW